MHRTKGWRRPAAGLGAGRRCLGALLASCALALPLQADADARWQLSISAAQHSDALPLSLWGADHFAPALQARSGANLAYLAHEIRLSHRGSWGRFGLLTRQSATLTASRGAIELAADAETSGRPAGDRQWTVDADYFAFEGSGLAWQHGWSPAPGWQLQGGVQALVLRRWRERRIDGDAGYDSAGGSYRAGLSSFEAGERLEFPYQTTFSGHGQGLLFDADLHWTGTRLSLHAGVRDVGRLRWSGLPQNTSQLSTDTRSLDADGFVVYQPLIQGRNAQATRSRSPPWRALAFVGWQASEDTRFEAGAEVLRGFGALPQLRATHRRGDWDFGLAVHTYERRVTARLGWRGLQLRVGTDRFGSQAQSRELAVAGSWPL